MTKVTVKVSIVAKRAKVEFKEGLGIGVLASQEMVFDVPEGEGYPVKMQLAALNLGEDLMKDTVDIKYEVIV